MRRRRDQNERKLAVSLEHQLETKPDLSAMELLLDEAIQALPPDEQAGIVARFFEGKDNPEIARLLTAQTARPRPPGHAAQWSAWRRRHQARSRWYHQRTRRAPATLQFPWSVSEWRLPY